MRIFVDTNIISEFLEDRVQAELVDCIFEASEIKGWTRVLSVGSFYTITYLTERFLRHQGISQPMLVEQQRVILSKILSAFEIQDLDNESLSSGVTDPNFLDLEDSYQYQSAIKADCSVLLTINKKDFKNLQDKTIEILTPQEFIDSYIG